MRPQDLEGIGRDRRFLAALQPQCRQLARFRCDSGANPAIFDAGGPRAAFTLRLRHAGGLAPAGFTFAIRRQRCPRASSLSPWPGLLAAVAACAQQEEEFVVVEPVSQEPVYTGKYK